MKSRLILISQILIIIGVLAIGTVPFLEQCQTRKSVRQYDLRQKFNQTRRYIDGATTLCEMSRLFESQQTLLDVVGASQLALLSAAGVRQEVQLAVTEASSKAIVQNQENHRSCVMAAVIFTCNALFSSAETSKEVEAAIAVKNLLNRPDGQTTQKLSEQYSVYLKDAIERGDKFIREIKNLETSISKVRLWKTVLGVSGLLINVIGLAIGIRASMPQHNT